MTLIAAGRRCQNILEDSTNRCRGCHNPVTWSTDVQHYVLLLARVDMSDPDSRWPNMFSICRNGQPHDMDINEWRCPNPAEWRVTTLIPNWETQVIEQAPQGYLCSVCAEDEMDQLAEDGTEGYRMTYEPLDASGTMVKVGLLPATTYGP